MIGLILKTGTKVSRTGFIKIVGDDRHNRCSVDRYNWELKAAEYDPQHNCTLPGPWFDVTEEEVLQWMKNS